MKIRSKTNETGESRELLLKEYFLNAYLIAALKQVGAGVRRRNAASATEGKERARDSSDFATQN